MSFNHANAKFFCLLLISLLLQGCERSTPEDILENYQYRISNVLEIEQRDNYQIPIRPLFPLRRQLKMPTVEIREGLFDLLKLKECGLLPLIAERNSSLGKVYLPSQKMSYELRFIHTLKTCSEKLSTATEENRKHQQLVNEILQIKQRNLPAELWNGIFTSKEIEVNFSRDKEPLPLQNDAEVMASISAIKKLTAIVRTPLVKEDWPLPPELSQIESFNEVLFINQSGSKILSSIQLMTIHLDQASDTLEQGMQKQKLCTNNNVSNKAKIMKNIFYKYYIGEVQPYLASVHKSGDGWLQATNHLINSFKEYELILPKELETYQRMILSKTDETSVWGRYIKARNKHTQAWQKLLKQCGMMPSG